VYAGNIIENRKVYCVVRRCSCFVTILKFYFFYWCQYELRRSTSGVMVWQGAALPISFYIVRPTSTRSRPLSHAGNIRTLQQPGRCNVTFQQSFQSVQIVMCVQDAV